MSRSNTTKNTANENSGNDDQTRSQKAWGKFTVEVLRLKANQYGIEVTGNKTVLKNTFKIREM